MDHPVNAYTRPVFIVTRALQIVCFVAENKPPVAFCDIIKLQRPSGRIVTQSVATWPVVQLAVRVLGTAKIGAGSPL